MFSGLKITTKLNIKPKNINFPFTFRSSLEKTECVN